MDPRFIAETLVRIEEKVDRVVLDLGKLYERNARLEEKFTAHDKVEVEARSAKQAVKTGLTWPLIVVMIGAIASAWVPTVFALGRAQTTTPTVISSPQK